MPEKPSIFLFQNLSLEKKNISAKTTRLKSCKLLFFLQNIEKTFGRNFWKNIGRNLLSYLVDILTFSDCFARFMIIRFKFGWQTEIIYLHSTVLHFFQMFT